MPFVTQHEIFNPFLFSNRLHPACKKGTSGKLYAMKVMNKKRIKIKKAEQLTLNEQKCLADVNSPFVVNLKYSLQSQGKTLHLLPSCDQCR